MALKSNFDFGRLEKETQQEADLIYERVIDSFIMAGEEFVKDARSQIQDHSMGTYKDQTTNLRNSIGYHIYREGQLVKMNTGRVAINPVDVQEHIKPKGIQLVGFAGMNYASHVESKGYNVISYQKDICLINLAVYLETLDVIAEGSAAKMEESFTP
jgi:hypothetical protein